MCERDDRSTGHTSNVGLVDGYMLNLNLESEGINPGSKQYEISADEENG